MSSQSSQHIWKVMPPNPWCLLSRRLQAYDKGTDVQVSSRWLTTFSNSQVYTGLGLSLCPWCTLEGCLKQRERLADCKMKTHQGSQWYHWLWWHFSKKLLQKRMAMGHLPQRTSGLWFQKIMWNLGVVAFPFPSGLVVKGDMECGGMRSTLHISRNLSTRNFSVFRSVPHYM